jgi:hypothetical protein
VDAPPELPPPEELLTSSEASFPASAVVEDPLVDDEHAYISESPTSGHARITLANIVFLVPRHLLHRNGASRIASTSLRCPREKREIIAR